MFSDDSKRVAEAIADRVSAGTPCWPELVSVRFVQFPWGGCVDRCIRSPGRGIRLIGYGFALLKPFPESVDG